MAKRNYDNWIEAFYSWVAPRSEAPESFLKLISLFTIATVVKKHVVIPRENMLGGWECYPNIYVVLIARPGVARKGTTMNFGEKLLFSSSNLVSTPQFISQSAMITAMTESPDGSIYVAADELSSIFQKSKGDMIDFLVDGYDTRKPLAGRTQLRGVEFVEKPCINFFACTQPDWMKENLPTSVITGGFASRTLFAYESQPRQRYMYYTEERIGITYKELEEIQTKLIEDLETIGDIKGEFAIEKSTMDKIEAWYQVDNKKELDTCDTKLQGYYARKPVHLHKLAMLHQLARSDELVLTMDNFKFAFKVLRDIESRMPHIFKAIGKNEYTADLSSIRTYLRQHKEVPLSTLYEVFESSAEPEKLKSLISFFVLSKEVSYEIKGEEVWYTYIGKKSDE